jgi:hypothetical protein
MLRYTVSCSCGKIVFHRLFQDNDLDYAAIVAHRTANNRVTASGLRPVVPVETILEHVPHGGFFVAHGPADGLLFPDTEHVDARLTRHVYMDLVSRYLTLDCAYCGSRLELASDGLRQMMTLMCPSCCLPSQQYPFEAVRAAWPDARLLLATLTPAPPLLQAHIARLEVDAHTEDTLRRLAAHDSWTLSRELGSTTAVPRTKALAKLEMLRLVESRARPHYGGSAFAHHQYRVTTLGAKLVAFLVWREAFAQERAKNLV